MKFRTVLPALLIVLAGISGTGPIADQTLATDPSTSQHPSKLQQQDRTPPNTIITLKGLQYAHDDILWVTSSTSHVLTAQDNVDPPTLLETNFRFYRVSSIEASAFNPYTQPFNLTGFDGRYRIEFFSVDTAGNVEPVNYRIEHLDSIPPYAVLSFGTPVYYDDLRQPWITDETFLMLSSEDPVANDGSPGSGVKEIRARISNTPTGPSTNFATYERPILIDGPDGQYQVDFFARDNIWNQGQLQSNHVFLDTTPPVVDLGHTNAGEEGAPIAFDAGRTMDAGSGVAEILWDLDRDGEFDDGIGPTASWTYGDDDSPFIGLQVADNLGNSDIVSIRVAVHNADPDVEITHISTTQPYPGQTVTLEGTFSDPGWLDTHTAVIDWGDGQTTEATVSERNEEPAAIGTFSAQHVYAKTGPLNLTVTAIDDDGGTGTTSTQIEVQLSPQMPGTLMVTDEITFYRLTATIPGTWGSARRQWQSGEGNPRYWWIGQGQGWLYLFPKTPNDAPAYDPGQSTEPWSNFLAVTTPIEDFQRWFWCGIPLYDARNRTIGIGCHPDWGPPPDGTGDLHPWIRRRIPEAEPHISNIIQATFQ